MSGYFGAFTPGGTQYSSTYAAPGFPSAPYGFAAPAATGYATAFQQAAAAPTRPEATSVGFAYASRPDGGGYVGGAPPIYASPLTAAATGVAASVIAGLSAAATKTAAASSGAPVSASMKLPPSTAPSAGNSTYTGYDAAVYAAATSYLQSKAVGGASQWLGLKKSNSTPSSTVGGYGSFGSGSSGGPGSGRPSFPRKMPSQPRPVQLHYCEICKISCAGPQTYREHLEGQKHKKKEAQAQGETQPLAKAKASFRCDLCSVTCTGQDTYNAHIRGAKHQKTLKLHQTLGKPIPSTDPIIIPPANAQKALADASGVKKVVGVPKVSFIGGQKLTTTGMIGATSEPVVEDKETDPSVYLALEKEVQPVGEDYVELIKSDDGKTTQYFCKLCDCRFNDMNAKDMHLKGRRHRLQFKKKVNPELEVEIKAPMKYRRFSDEKRYQHRDGWAPPGMYPSPMMAPAMMTHGPVPLFGGHSANRQALANDMDDQYVLTKHALIFPSDDEMKGITNMVTNVERALKTISDNFAEEEKQKKDAEKSVTDECTPSKPASEADERLLKGAMRVGILSKGLLVRGDPSVQLVVLCAEKPTESLLGKVADLLPKHLADVTSEEYDVEKDVPEAAINVISTTDKITVTVSLTSIFMRDPVGGEAANKPDPTDVLDKQKCLEALASLRRAKWFQAKCMNLQSCSTILRLLRDLCQRLPTWMPLSNWASELLVEKVLSSTGMPLGPAEAFRRVFEALASGILLPGGPGLLDPCEKEPVDASANMALQQREDLTASAQHALRLITFKQIYKVLGIERSAVKGNAMPRKRPLESVESMEEGTPNGKKDKKEEEMD